MANEIANRAAWQLYTLPKEFAAILAETPESGEMSDEQIAQLEALDLAIDEKIQCVCIGKRQCDLMADAMENEIRRLQGMKAKLESNAQRFKELVQRTLEKTGKRKVETALFSAWLQKNPPSVRVNCQVDDLPEWAKRTKVIVEADKTAMLAAAKDGKELPPNVEVVQEMGVRIK